MFLQLNDMKIYYEVAGSGNTVLLLHGWGTDSRSLRPILEYLKESVNVRAYALDFPGFGFSDLPKAAWEVSDFVSLVLDFLDRLHLDKVDIVAHSFGGRVAIKLAAEYPQRVTKLVLVDSGGIRPDRTAIYHLKVYLFKTIKVFAKILPGSASKLVRAKILSKMGSTDYQNAGEMQQTFVKIVNEDLRHFLPAVKCPTLLIWGELDAETPLRNAQVMKQMIPGAKLDVLEGVGHFCYLDNFPAFSAVLSSFIGGNR
jgi:pimeloyl-ACP methyl ester carboxylesterase